MVRGLRAGNQEENVKAAILEGSRRADASLDVLAACDAHRKEKHDISVEKPKPVDHFPYGRGEPQEVGYINAIGDHFDPVIGGSPKPGQLLAPLFRDRDVG